MRLTGNIDQVLKGVCFVGIVNDRGNFVPSGTAFFISAQDRGFWFYYLVTARHVIEDMHDVITEVHIRVNLKEGGTDLIAIPRGVWRFHPEKQQGRYVDVAATFFTKPPEVKLLHMQVDEHALTPKAIEEENIGVGSGTFTIGLFTNHAGVDKNFPVARFGNIALMSQEPMWTEYGFMEGYLVESHSLGGSSGSPVFVTPELWQMKTTGPKLSAQREWYFLGLISGVWMVENPQDAVSTEESKTSTGRMNTGMMIAVPVSKIKEALDHPDLLGARSQFIESEKERVKGTFQKASVPVEQDLVSKARDEMLRTMLGTPPQPRTQSAPKPVKRK